MDRDFGQNSAGDVVHCDEELAQHLADSGMAHLADESEVNGGDDKEEDQPEDNMEPEAGKDDKPAPKPVEESFRAAQDILIKGVEKAVTNLTNTVKRPAVKATKAHRTGAENVHVAGSDHARTGGFKSMGDFASSAFARSKGDWNAAKKFSKWQDVISTKATGMSIAGSHVGSDLVPQEWAEELFRLAFKDVPDLLSMCQRYKMHNQIENIPTFVQSSATSGITAAVTAETTTASAGTIAASVQPTATVQLSLTKEGVLVNLSDEIMRFNSYNLESHIKQVVPERLCYYINDAIVNGNSGSNVNLIGNAATVFIGRAAANAINILDVYNMRAALFNSYRTGACWLVNPSTTPNLYTMGFPNSSASTQIPVFLPGTGWGGAGPAPLGQLAGFPIYELENVPGLGSTGDLLLVHMPSIAAGYSELIADYTKALYFNIAQDSFRFLFYFSTVNPLTVPYTRKNGSYASNIVALNSGSLGSI